MNCWRDVNDGSTDWLRFKCRAALRRVESEMLLLMPAEEEEEEDVAVPAAVVTRLLQPLSS